MQRVIKTDRAPGAIGPYSQAIEVNGMLYTSGVIPINPATGEIGITPDVYNIPLTSIACDYGPIAPGALSVLILSLIHILSGLDKFYYSMSAYKSGTSRN